MLTVSSLYMLPVAVAQCSSDDIAVCYVFRLFADDVMFSHNKPNTDRGMESVT